MRAGRDFLVSRHRGAIVQRCVAQNFCVRWILASNRRVSRRSRLGLPRVSLVLLLVLAWVGRGVGADDAVPAQEPGTLYLYRPGASAQVTVTTRVNAEEAGRLDPDTFFRWELPAGAYQITARSQTNVAKRTVRVEPGKSTYVEQSFVVDFRSFRRVRLSEVSPERGAASVARLSRARSRSAPSVVPAPPETTAGGRSPD